MNYSTDKPIETENKDLLSRSSFSKQLGKGIYEYNDKSGLVIGLFGKWGTGKRQLLIWLKRKLIDFHKQMKISH